MISDTSAGNSYQSSNKTLITYLKKPQYTSFQEARKAMAQLWDLPGMRNDMGIYEFPEGASRTLDLAPGSYITVRAAKLAPEKLPKFFRLGTEVYTQAFGELKMHARFWTEQAAKDYIAGDKG